MRVMAGTLDSDRLLFTSAHHLVPRLNMWLKQYVYLNGQQMWISQPASPLRLGSLMQTVQAPHHDPARHFSPEYGELTKLHGPIAEVGFSENRRRFHLTMKSVIGTPITTVCTITNVRRSASNGGWAADVTGTAKEGKLQIPTQEMCIKTILAARGNPTGRSWAFLRFKVPSGGEQIVHHQLSSFLASRPQLTSTKYTSCQLAGSLQPGHANPN